MATPEQLSRLQAAARAAVASEGNTGVPALLSVAQWAQESAWGAKTPGCNAFGIKAYPGCWSTVTFTTTEYIGGVANKLDLVVAAFPSLQACFDKHGQLLSSNKIYGAAFAAYKSSGDPYQFARDIAVHYATDPKYGDLIVALMRQNNIQQAVTAARLPSAA